MRLFHESLTFTSTSGEQRWQIQRLVTATDHRVACQDNPSFRLTAWDDLDQKLREVKTREMGENDLHLARPGLWTATLYPEIWGIPETWMILLSQTIRLGNEKDLAGHQNDVNSLTLREFSHRSKALERCILDWNEFSDRTSDAEPRESQDETASIEKWHFDSALKALHHALIIYFYRRVHDLDSSLLQTHVVQVMDNLRAFQQHIQLGNRYASVLIWPAFIAACEATSKELQISFLRWFETSAQHNGQKRSRRIQTFVNSLWSKQNQPGNCSLTWLNLLKSM